MISQICMNDMPDMYDDMTDMYDDMTYMNEYHIHVYDTTFHGVIIKTGWLIRDLC